MVKEGTSVIGDILGSQVNLLDFSCMIFTDHSSHFNHVDAGGCQFFQWIHKLTLRLMINTFHFFKHSIVLFTSLRYLSTPLVLFLWGNILWIQSPSSKSYCFTAVFSCFLSLSLHATLPLVGVYLYLFRMGVGWMGEWVKNITQSSRSGEKKPKAITIMNKKAIKTSSSLNIDHIFSQKNG